MILIERYLCSQIALLAKSLRIFLNWTWRNLFFMMSCRISSNNFIKKKIKCFNLSLFLISITESWSLGKHSKSKFCVSVWYQNSVWKTSHFLMGFWMNYIIHSEKVFSLKDNDIYDQRWFIAKETKIFTEIVKKREKKFFDWKKKPTKI